MRNFWMVILTGLSLAAFIHAIEKRVDLNGTWIFDPAQSDSGGQSRQSRRVGGSMGGRGGFPGGISPGIGYPGSRRAGGYPGGGNGNDGGGTDEGMPRGRMQNLTLSIVQTENEIQTTRKFTVNGKEQTIAQKFDLDGSQDSNPASNGRGEFTSKSSWKNDKLVNLGTQTMTMQDQSHDVTVKEEYSLSKDGKTLTIKTTRTTPRGETSSKQAFNKQEPSSIEPAPSGQ